VQITRKQDLDRRKLGVETDLALEDYRSLEHLTGMRKAQIGLKSDTVVQPALQNVCAAKGVLNHRNATRLNISLREADPFILVTQLSNQTGKDVALKETGIHMNVPSELTTFIKIHCILLCV